MTEIVRSATRAGEGAAAFVLLAKMMLLAMTAIATPSLAQDASAQPAKLLEDIMGFQFSSDLTMSAEGDAVAWIVTHRGERNVWMARGPRFQPSQVTAFRGDDGQLLSSLRLSADGQRIVFIRGTSSEDGHVLNPRSLSEPPAQALWVADTSGRARKVGEADCAPPGCSDPQISSVSSHVAWATGERLWLADLASTGPARQLLHVRGRLADLRWSPDGSKLAFSVQRGAHAFIGVLELRTGEVRYLAPTLSFDKVPRWSADGGKIAFFRVQEQDPRAPIALPQQVPWSIVVHDLATDSARTVWASSGDGNASVPDRTDEDRPLIYTSDGRLVFTAESSGWNHIYTVSEQGGEPTMLTRGTFEVEDVELGADGQSLLYTSNEAGTELRHLWQVSLKTRQSRQLTRGDTISWSPLASRGGSLFCLGSTGRTPASLYRVESADRKLIFPTSFADYPSASLVEPEAVEFKSADGTIVRGQLFQPRRPAKGSPGIVYVHGGPRRQMVLGFHYLDYYHQHYALNQYLAALGYSVLSVNYRTGTMYGRAFRVLPDGEWRGAAEYQDVLAAGRYLIAERGVDPKRLGIWGGSNGGYLTALALARNSDVFAAGVDFAGVHDWIADSLRFGDKPAPVDLDVALEKAWGASPMAHVAQWRSPVLLIHGDDDRAVPIAQSIQLAARLRARGVVVEQLILPDETHSFALAQSWLRSFSATVNFFGRHLQAR